MNLHELFQDFNPMKFLVYLNLLVFSLLMGLRLDGVVTSSYWAVFLPLWLWKMCVMVAALTGIIVWARNPQYRSDATNVIHLKAMLLCTGCHMLLMLFELLVVDMLERQVYLWMVVFTPLFCLSVASIVLCIWAVKHQRTFEMEIFCAVNTLQFIFVALRLDNYISWTWKIVFVPLWIVMCVAMVGVVYIVVLAIMVVRSPDVEQGSANVVSALGYTLLFLPILVFQVLLANKLDGDTSTSYTALVIPFVLSLLALMLMAFNTKPANPWWFGIRKDFSQAVLGCCPALQEYANIAVKIERKRTDMEEGRVRHASKAEEAQQQQPRTVMPIVSIEVPD